MKKKSLIFSLFLIFVFLLALSLIKIGGLQMKADVKPIYYVITNPGEDTTKSMSITWQAEAAGSYVEYTLKTDTEFEKAIKVTPNEELWSTEGIVNTQPDNTFETHKRYVCNLTLNNLSEATDYMYRVVSGSYKTENYYFSTSGLTNTWNFLAFTDFQCRYNTITHPLIRQMLEVGKNPNLVICSGDQVDVAGDERDWNWFFNTDETIFNSFVYASAPGDHAYWGASINGSYPQYAEPYTFNKLFTFPKNGTEKALNTNYYFYYNNVLFVSLDMCDSNTVSSGKIDAEVKWMKETVKALEGTYQYLVVFDHKSIYGAYSEDSRVATTLRPQWYPVFDLLNVDLVLSGHDHMYSRTYQLYNNKKTTNTSRGTYYLDMGSSGDKYRTTEEKIMTDGLHEKTYDLKNLQISMGANIEVSPTQMKVTVYDNNKKVRDTFYINAKRNASSINCDGFNKEEFYKNVSINASSNTNGTLNITSNQNTKYIDKVLVTSNDNTCLESTIDLKNIKNSYSLNNISSLKANVKVTLKDGTEHNEEVMVNMGALSNLKTRYEDKKLYLTYGGAIYNVIDYDTKLYIDGTLNKTASSSEASSKKIEVPIEYLHGNHNFTIKCEAQGVVLGEVELDYNTYRELELGSKELTLKEGASFNIQYSYDYSDLLSISSTDASVVSVDSQGSIKALKEGSAVIEFSVEGIESPYTVNVTVEKAKSNVAIIAVSSVSSVSILGVLGFLILKKKKLI